MEWILIVAGIVVPTFLVYRAGFAMGQLNETRKIREEFKREKELMLQKAKHEREIAYEQGRGKGIEEASQVALETIRSFRGY